MKPTLIHRGNVLFFAGFVLSLFACSGKDDPAKTDAAVSDAAPASDAQVADGSSDAGSVSSIACYIGVQFRCKEFPEATKDQLDNLPVECSSASGELSTNPAACPKAGFLGKCTVGSAATKDLEVRRFYTGADAAYEQDFCVNTAKGAWSTTF